MRNGLDPLFFLHLHKCGGTTFIKAAAANGHLFAFPGNNGMPFPAEDWSAVAQPFWRGTHYWEFWKEKDWESVTAKIQRIVSAGVTCIVQEYGPYDARLWQGFTRAMCIRHPLDRLYSDFLHMEEGGKNVLRGTKFLDWLQAGTVEKLRKFYVLQLGQGDFQRALDALHGFDVIVVQEHFAATLDPMRRYGWTSTDPEKYFKSWTARRTTTGREVLSQHPKLLATLREGFAADIAIYERAVELAFRGLHRTSHQPPA